MEAPLDFLPTITREDIREKIKKDKEEKEFQKNMLDKVCYVFCVMFVMLYRKTLYTFPFK